MYLNVLLLSLTAVAFAQNAPSSCPCSTLQSCVQQKKAAFEACKAQCQIPGVAQKCFTDKKTAFAALPRPAEPSNCLFTPGKGLCVAGARFACQVANVQGKSEWHHDQGHEHVQIEELKPYFECIKACEPKPNHPEHAAGATGAHQWPKHEGAQGNRSKHEGGHHGHRGGGKMFEAFHLCANESSCIINLETAGEAFKSCKPEKVEVAGDEFKQIGQTFCVCLREAYGKSATEMPCTPHSREGKPQA